MLVEFLPEVMASPDEVAGAGKSKLDDLRADPGVIALRIGRALPGARGACPGPLDRPAGRRRGPVHTGPGGRGAGVRLCPVLARSAGDHVDHPRGNGRGRGRDLPPRRGRLWRGPAGWWPHRRLPLRRQAASRASGRPRRFRHSGCRFRGRGSRAAALRTRRRRRTAGTRSMCSRSTTGSVKRSAVNVDARIELLVLNTNLRYRNSGITTRLRLVHSYETSYAAAGERNSDGRRTDLGRLRATGDGWLDDVHERRDRSAADVVLLLYQTPENRCGGGMGYRLNHHDGFDDAGWAFAVSGVGRREACSEIDSHTFAHEIGHVQGAAHNPEQERLDNARSLAISLRTRLLQRR